MPTEEMFMERFNIKEVTGKKLYKYEDCFGNIGKSHIATTKFSPFQWIQKEDGSCLLILPNNAIAVSSIDEIDAICEAFENHKSTLEKILSSPSEKLVSINSELVLKLLSAIESKLLALENENLDKNNLQDNKKSSFENYEIMNLVEQKRKQILDQIETMLDSSEFKQA